MYKRIVILFLLLTSVSFYSCSTKNKVKKPRKKDIIIPEHSLPQQEEEKEIPYEKAVKIHHKSQTKSARRSMKENVRRSKDTTPLRKTKSKSCFINKN